MLYLTEENFLKLVYFCLRNISRILEFYFCVILIFKLLNNERIKIILNKEIK